MKIRFRQSGGIAGLAQSCEIDTRLLPRPEATEIEDLVKLGGVLKRNKVVIGSVLKRKIKLSKTLACDIFGYSISVESSEVAYHVKFDDFTIPEGGRPLLDYLKKRALPQPL